MKFSNIKFQGEFVHRVGTRQPGEQKYFILRFSTRDAHAVINLRKNSYIVFKGVFFLVSVLPYE